jgi:hypothetical protein
LKSARCHGPLGRHQAGVARHPAHIDGDLIRFSLASPDRSHQVNGWHHALHLFANPPADAAPAGDKPGLRVFGPGVHRPGKIELKSNESVYIDGGAVVYGSIHASNATNIAIRGRGVLDVSQAERGMGGGAIRLSGCSDVSVEGLVLRDPDVWCFSLFGCSRVDIANVKLVGLWRYNAAGIDVCNSQSDRARLFRAHLRRRAGREGAEIRLRQAAGAQRALQQVHALVRLGACD